MPYRFFRALSIASTIVASLVVVGVVSADEAKLPALTYDQADERLFKVESNQLFLSDIEHMQWRDIPLPEAGQMDGW